MPAKKRATAKPDFVAKLSKPSAMSHAAQELLLYGENNRQLHDARELPIIKNLVLKIAQGKYSSTAAVKLWMYWADDAAQRYHKEFGSGGTWHTMFPKSDREQAAKAAASYFEQEYALGNYSHHLPKKYGGRG